MIISSDTEAHTISSVPILDKVHDATKAEGRWVWCMMQLSGGLENRWVEHEATEAVVQEGLWLMIDLMRQRMSNKVERSDQRNVEELLPAE